MALIRRWYRDGMANCRDCRRCAASPRRPTCPRPARLGRARRRGAARAVVHLSPAVDDRGGVPRAVRPATSAAGVAFSVGVVGQRDHHAAARSLRAALPERVYVWINARSSRSPGRRRRARRVARDRPAVRRQHGALAEPGQGVRRRRARDQRRRRRHDATRHFIAEGRSSNLYEPGWERALAPRPCSNDDCHCYIGYAHLDYLELDKVYAGGLLERVPTRDARAGRVRLPQLRS